MTILFDPVTAKAMNPNFDPTAVLYLGAIFVSGAQGETTPVPMTFLLASDETS